MMNSEQTSSRSTPGSKYGSNKSSFKSLQSGNTLYNTMSRIQGMTDYEIVKNVERLRNQNRRLDLESTVWFNFLSKHDPRSIQGIEKILQYINAATSSALPKLHSDMSGQPTLKSASLSSVTSTASSISRKESSVLTSWLTGQFSGQIQSVNYATKLEILKKDMESSEFSIRSFLEKCKSKKAALKAQLEEVSLELTEIREAKELFDQSVVKGVDRITGRIPAEKFIRYMEEWLKSADSIIEKLRLKTSTLHYKLKNLHSQLSQKEELGESLNPVDFDQMRIEKKILMDKMEIKNADLLQLKQKAGGINLLLAKSKRLLHKQLAAKNVIIGQIQDLKQKKEAIDRERDEVEIELKQSKENLDKIRDLIENYSVPDVLKYMEINKELDYLRRDVKVWSRRNHLQEIALDSCIKTMKRITGKPEESTSWFSFKTKSSDDLLI